MKRTNTQVLVVEDDSQLLTVLTDRLHTKGYAVVKAVDGEEAINVVLAKQPNLILLDMLLPKLDGFKVLERIRQYPDKIIAATPVIVLSNLWSDKDILAARALKIEEYYVKAHTNLEDVFKKVDEVLLKM